MVHPDKDPILSVTGATEKFIGLRIQLQIGEAEQLPGSPSLCLLPEFWMLLNVAGWWIVHIAAMPLRNGVQCALGSVFLGH